MKKEAIENQVKQMENAPAVVYDQEHAQSLIVAEQYAGGELSLTDQINGASRDLYCSIVDDGSRAAKVKIYNALSQNDGKLLELAKKGATIQVSDVIAHKIKLIDENTGYPVEVNRIVLITPDGKSYSATAKGVFSSITNIVGIVGKPSWADDPITVKPVEVPTRNGGFYTLTLALV